MSLWVILRLMVTYLESDMDLLSSQGVLGLALIASFIDCFVRPDTGREGPAKVAPQNITYGALIVHENQWSKSNKEN